MRNRSWSTEPAAGVGASGQRGELDAPRCRSVRHVTAPDRLHRLVPVFLLSTQLVVPAPEVSRFAHRRSPLSGARHHECAAIGLRHPANSPWAVVSRLRERDRAAPQAAPASRSRSSGDGVRQERPVSVTRHSERASPKRRPASGPASCTPALTSTRSTPERRCAVRTSFGATRCQLVPRTPSCQ